MKAMRRKFRMTNYELSAWASKLVSLMTRDTAEFTARGVTTAQRAEIDTLNTAFKALPRDNDAKAKIKIAADEKLALKKTIITEIITISGYMEQAFGRSSGQYNRLGIKKLQVISDKELTFCARDVSRIASEYIAKLTPFGCTQAKLDALTADANTYDAKLTAISDAKTNRKTQTSVRLSKGNDLYDLISKYCAIGKLIWENVNKTKFEDYVITDITPTTPLKIQNLKYDQAAKFALWDVDSSAEEYELMAKSKDPTGEIPDWKQIYLNKQNKAQIGLAHGEYLLRCRGINEVGSGIWSDELEIIAL